MDSVLRSAGEGGSCGSGGVRSSKLFSLLLGCGNKSSGILGGEVEDRFLLMSSPNLGELSKCSTNFDVFLFKFGRGVVSLTFNSTISCRTGALEGFGVCCSTGSWMIGALGVLSPSGLLGLLCSGVYGAAGRAGRGTAGGSLRGG
jgi:hypothetical protein